MKSIRLLFILGMSLLTVQSCDKQEKSQSLEDFCSVKPAGWQCEIIESDFNTDEIPHNADTPVAIVKYSNENQESGELTSTALLILNLYPINKKEELIEFIRSQQVYSWCIPVYFGETSDYFIITSPCFANSGTSAEDMDSSIEDLYVALDNIITQKDYGLTAD